jgi:signal transduction histidine kinase
MPEQFASIRKNRLRKVRKQDAFYTTKAEGIGMGLAISRSIIEAHGGRLWATPGQPSGAVFQLTLPTVQEEPA